MIPVSQLGWMAGVIDLKGRVQFKNNQQRKTRQAVLIIDSKQTDVIALLAAMTGTRPEPMPAKPLKDFMRRGCVEHCPENHVHVGEEGLMMPAHSRWTITGAGMAVVVYNLLPYLQIDKDWLALINKVIGESPLTGRGASAIMAQLRRLADLGWELPERFQRALGQVSEPEPVEGVNHEPSI